jgi:hypothetical protein
MNFPPFMVKSLPRPAPVDPLFLRIDVKLARINREIESTERNLAAFLRGEVNDSMSGVIVRDVAYALHNAYNGMEAILQDIAAEVDGGVPAGASAHRALLDQLSVPTRDRPAVVVAEIADQMDDLRRFRHLFRHSYGVDLQSEQVFAKFADLTAHVFPQFQKAIGDMRTFLGKEI